jgi:hypothetical protein
LKSLDCFVGYRLLAMTALFSVPHALFPGLYSFVILALVARIQGSGGGLRSAQKETRGRSPAAFDIPLFLLSKGGGRS